MSRQQIKDPKKLTEIAKEAVIKYTDQIEINRKLQADNAALRQQLSALLVSLEVKEIDDLMRQTPEHFAKLGEVIKDNITERDVKIIDLLQKIEERTQEASHAAALSNKHLLERDDLRQRLARLVEAAKRYLNRDNIAVSGMDSWKLKVDLQQAIAAAKEPA